MIYKYIVKSLILISIFVAVACGPQRQPVPVGFIPPPLEVTEQDKQFGQQVLSQLAHQYPVSNDPDDNIRVTEIVNRLAESIGAENQPWRVTILKGDQVANAGATRGNFMFVWTGMINKIWNDDELATIIAHEMAHVLARHTHPTPGEEAQALLIGIADATTQQVISAHDSYGALAALGGQLVSELLKGIIINPEQQRQEHEADQIGLFIMAKAKYDPRKAVSFWERVQTDPDFSGISIAFLSSHPTSDERAEKLKDILPLAFEEYRKSLPTSKKSSKPKLKAQESFDYRK